MATNSSILVWKTPCTEEPGGLQSMGLAKSRTWLSRYACVRAPMCMRMHAHHPHTHTIDAHNLLRAANLRAHREILVAQWLEESLGGIFLSLQLSTNTDRLTPYWEIVLVRISRFHEYIKISGGLPHHSACVAAWEIPSKAILQMWFIIMHYMSEILWHFNIYFNYVV